MENKEIPQLELGRIGYEAYFAHAGGKSLAHGGELPPWDKLEQKFVEAWNAAGAAVALALMEEMKRQGGDEITIGVVGEPVVEVSEVLCLWDWRIQPINCEFEVAIRRMQDGQVVKFGEMRYRLRDGSLQAEVDNAWLPAVFQVEMLDRYWQVAD